MRKKLLIYIGNLDIGGAQNMAFELAKKIQKYDVEFLVHGKRFNNTLEEKIETMFPVTYLNYNNQLNYNMLRSSLAKISKINPDVIHCHMGTVHVGYIWCRLHRRKCVVTIHTRPDVAFSKANEFFVKLGIKNNHLSLVAVSKENQELCNQYFKTDRVMFVNNGIDISKYYRKEHEMFTFINVARHDENKNQQVIVKSFARIKKEENNEIKLYMLGTGPTSEKLKNLARELNAEDSVIFTGNVGNTEDYYAVSDCFVLSSHREALPMTCIEAMASGIPVVSTNVGGLKDIINESTGILVDDNDEDSYYCAMKNMISESSAFELKCKEMANAFSSEKMGIAYENIYSRN